MERGEQPDQLSTAPSGRYANSFNVGYNAFEFLLDCGQCFPDQIQQTPHTRIITSPAYALALHEVLSTALRNYEQQFGPISLPGSHGEGPVC
jgi:hypothetical protein